MRQEMIATTISFETARPYAYCFELRRHAGNSSRFDPAVGNAPAVIEELVGFQLETRPCDQLGELCAPPARDRRGLGSQFLRADHLAKCI